MAITMTINAAQVQRITPVESYLGVGNAPGFQFTIVMVDGYTKKCVYADEQIALEKRDEILAVLGPNAIDLNDLGVSE